MIADLCEDSLTDLDLTAKSCATQCALEQRRRLFVYAFVCVCVRLIVLFCAGPGLFGHVDPVRYEKKRSV